MPHGHKNAHAAFWHSHRRFLGLAGTGRTLQGAPKSRRAVQLSSASTDPQAGWATTARLYAHLLATHTHDNSPLRSGIQTRRLVRVIHLIRPRPNRVDN